MAEVLCNTSGNSAIEDVHRGCLLMGCRGRKCWYKRDIIKLITSHLIMT